VINIIIIIITIIIIIIMERVCGCITQHDMVILLT